MKEIKTEYYIKDWAGNYMFDYITFPTYEDASEFLLMKFPEDEDLQEFYIDKVDEKFIEIFSLLTNRASSSPVSSNLIK